MINRMRTIRNKALKDIVEMKTDEAHLDLTNLKESLHHMLMPEQEKLMSTSITVRRVVAWVAIACG